MNHALSSLPPILQALSVLAHAHRVQGDPARSALLLEAIDHLHPNDSGVLLALAAAELGAARPQQALAALERLMMAGGSRQRRRLPPAARPGPGGAGPA